jgi:hypothetical protein
VPFPELPLYGGDDLRKRAYPLRPELVDVAGDVDFWADDSWMMSRLMRIAYDEDEHDLLRQLEPIRERAAAQYAYALATE